MNARRRFTQLQRLAPGTVFALSGSPADTLRWKLGRIAAGVAYVERLHDDKTKKIQKADPALMVWALTETETEPERYVFPDEVFPADEETEDE